MLFIREKETHTDLLNQNTKAGDGYPHCHKHGSEDICILKPLREYTSAEKKMWIVFLSKSKQNLKLV